MTNQDSTMSHSTAELTVEQLFWKWWNDERGADEHEAAAFHAGYREAATRLEHLERALRECRDTFRDYERQHEAKAQQIFDNGKAQGLLNAERMSMQARLTKAARNREMADMCDRALNQGTSK